MIDERYFEVITNAVTGEQTIRYYTEEEIAAAKALEASVMLVPESVTPRQVRLLLLQQGLLDQVESIIVQADRATQITWEFAIEFHRRDPLLLALAQQLNLTEQQVDQFFIAASQL